MKSRETGNSPTTQFVIRFSEDCPREKWNDITCECGLSKQARRTGVPNEKYSVYRTDDVCEAKAIVDMMRKHNYIDYGAEAVCLDNLTTFATDRLVAAFPAGATQAERDAVRKLLKSEKDVKVESSYDSSLTLRLGDPKKDIEEIASDLQGRIRKAGFPRVSVRSDSVILYNTEEQGAASASERTSFEESQAALQLIEAYGAQDLLSDEPAIRIAIIDSGFDDEHPDLKEVKSSWYNPFTRQKKAKPLEGDGHGTACAGIAVAPRNNRGVLGVAAGNELIGIRFVDEIVSSEDEDGDEEASGENGAKKNGARRWKLAPQEIADSINHAWRELGADVISLSWGWSLFLSTKHEPILEAIAAAVRLGRDGKGCIVVASSGNEGADFPSFPASMKSVMAVAACDTTGVPKRKNQNGEGSDWGSNKGDRLSVAAPGLNVWTTDVHGEGGYNKSGDYFPFKGTSAAAPIVAGVAGLVLRANPGLTTAQVREIIQSTAKKTGTDATAPVRYNSKGHSNEMGFGCVNAYEAVKLAKQTPPAG